MRDNIRIEFTRGGEVVHASTMSSVPRCREQVRLPGGLFSVEQVIWNAATWNHGVQASVTAVVRRVGL